MINESFVNLSGLDVNDIINGCDQGICVSVWFQGCPHHCKGCHNPETWCESSENQVKICFHELWANILLNIDKNGIKRNLSILGGEPLSEDNRHNTLQLIDAFRRCFPNRDIFLWTGYTMEEIEDMFNGSSKDMSILKSVSLLITDRFEIEKRDISLKYRGSSNQRVWKPVDTFFKKRVFRNISNIIDK